MSMSIPLFQNPTIKTTSRHHQVYYLKTTQIIKLEVDQNNSDLINSFWIRPCLPEVSSAGVADCWCRGAATYESEREDEGWRSSSRRLLASPVGGGDGRNRKLRWPRRGGRRWWRSSCRGHRRAVASQRWREQDREGTVRWRRRVGVGRGRLASVQG
jgi:hypothetical protein